jgi:hypothetical protein
MLISHSPHSRGSSDLFERLIVFPALRGSTVVSGNTDTFPAFAGLHRDEAKRQGKRVPRIRGVFAWGVT